MRSLKRFDLNETFSADCVISDDARAGEVYHVARNGLGGAILTPIAYYFVWKPMFAEGVRDHWRIDCFVRKHSLSPDPMKLGESLVDALMRENLCEEPVWMSAHRSDEVNGIAYGDLFSDD